MPVETTQVIAAENSDHEDHCKECKCNVIKVNKEIHDRPQNESSNKTEDFQRELKKAIGEELSSGNYQSALLSLQNTDLLLPNNRSGHAYGGLGRGIPSLLLVSDISDEDTAKFTPHEIQLRCKVASLYRLIDLNGWSQGIFNHISARINQTDEHFLLNPFGLLYSEVTASSLEKIDLDGQVIEHGSTSRGVNKAGFVLHSAIHQVRPDAMCIIHLHTGDAVAVSTMKCGLLPMSQEALIVGKVSYHDYNGILVDKQERQEIQHNLGPKNKVMFLRNHGVVVCGSTVEEAYHLIVLVMLACQSQVKALSAGLENLILVNEEVQRKTFEIGNKGGGGVGTGKQTWGTGEMEFEAVMRQLDSVGFKTGYTYKHVSSTQKVITGSSTEQTS